MLPGVHLDVLNKNVPVVQDGFGGNPAVAGWPHVMLDQCLAGHDPRALFAADDDFAGKGALALGALVRDDFFVVIALPGTLSLTSGHGSPSFHRAADSKHVWIASRQSFRNHVYTVPVYRMSRRVKYPFRISIIMTFGYAMLSLTCLDRLSAQRIMITKSSEISIRQALPISLRTGSRLNLIDRQGVL